jgi:hypothetical protein
MLELWVFSWNLGVVNQDAVQADRDDPDQPLVTPPFGHASQV